MARVDFDATSNPSGIQSLGITLDPEADYELRADGSCYEDPAGPSIKGLSVWKRVPI